MDLRYKDHGCDGLCGAEKFPSVLWLCFPPGLPVPTGGGQHLETSLVTAAAAGCAAGIQWREARGAGKPAVPGTAPPQGPHTISAGAENCHVVPGVGEWLPLGWGPRQEPDTCCIYTGVAVGQKPASELHTLRALPNALSQQGSGSQVWAPPSALPCQLSLK